MTASKRQRRLAKHKPSAKSVHQRATYECCADGHSVRLDTDGTAVCMCAPKVHLCMECRQVWPCDGAS